MVASVFCTSRCSRIRSWKNGRPKTSCSRLCDKTFPYNTSKGFFLGDVFSFKFSRTTARSQELLILFLLCVVTAPHHRCSVANLACDPCGFRWSYADNFGVLARGANCTNVHLARLIAGVQKAGLDVHDISLASGSADVLGYEVSPAKRVLQWPSGEHALALSHGRSLRAVASAGGRWSSQMVTSLSWRSGKEPWWSLNLDASFRFARSSYLVSGTVEVALTLDAKPGCLDNVNHHCDEVAKDHPVTVAHHTNTQPNTP